MEPKPAYSRFISPLTDLEEVIGDDGQAPSVVSVVPEVGIVVEHICEHIQEEVQRILVQEVDLVQRVKCEVDTGARLKVKKVATMMIR